MLHYFCIIESITKFHDIYTHTNNLTKLLKMGSWLGNDAIKI
jgi:hypothetical protein